MSVQPDIAVASFASPPVSDDVVTLPVIIPQSKVQPVYPMLARQARLPGKVSLDAVVLKDGSVGDIENVRCTHEGIGFEEAAIEALRQWRSEPATQNGQPVAVYFSIWVKFELR